MDQIGRACNEIGFFYVSGHGVPETTVEAARRFFERPVEAKMAMRAGATNRGYTPMRGSEHEPGKADVNEGFEMGFPVPAGDRDADGSNPVRMPNRWPERPSFREPVEAYYEAVFDLGLTILRGFALHFDLPETVFADRFTRPVADMRLAQYPPRSGSRIEYGTFDHTDHASSPSSGRTTMAGLKYRTGRETCYPLGRFPAPSLSTSAI